MKKYLFVLIAFSFLAGASCQEKIDIEKEKEAIIKVLYEEGERFNAFDLEGITALHITDESATRYNGEVYSGWDDIESLYKGYIARNKVIGDNNSRNEKDNILIKVTGNNAWVICDNIWKWEENGEENSNLNKQIAFLEKINGKWKFAFNAFVAIPE